MSNQTTTTGTGTTASKKSTAPIGPMEELLRGEVSAIEAYEQVMNKLDSENEKNRLVEFLEDHKMARDYWTKQIQSKNEFPKQTSGPWGTFVEAFVGTSKLLGNTAALKALEEGEEHGLKQYCEFLDNDKVPEEQKRFVRETLVPNQERHITSITAMTNLH